jgi:xylulokinase
MSASRLLLTHDMGTTANKSCLYRLGDGLELLDSFLVEYPTYNLGAGAVEQNADEWWSAVRTATQAIVARTKVDVREIAGMAFCAQMQGTVFVDEKGSILRNPMNYIDGRATDQLERYLQRGMVRIKSMNAKKVLQSLYITGGVAATAKDPIWKYHWVRENEPETYKRIHKWLDVKDYLILR